MRKIMLLLLLWAAAATFAAGRMACRHRSERNRWKSNCSALTQEVEHYRTRSNESAASAEALRLRCDEFQRLRADDAAEIRRLGIRIRRLEAAARHVVQQHVEVRTVVRDTILVRDTIRLFRWRDTWTSVEGSLRGDSVDCRVESVDTLRQIVHRIPRRFLFFRWGTKAIRQEIVSANPHAQIVYTKCLQIER